jgi:hypothetical protein
MTVPLWAWAAFVAFVVAMLALDLFVAVMSLWDARTRPLAAPRPRPAAPRPGGPGSRGIRPGP